MTWNIWKIRNRYLRAAVAWLLAGLAGVVVLVALPFVLVACAVAGAGELVRAMRSDDWGWIRATFWRAATGKEAV